MSKALDPLKKEHEVIVKVLRDFEGRIERFWKDEEIITPKNIEDMLRFSEEYVVKSHFVKEEHCLLPVLAEGGVGEDSINVVIKEHKSVERIVRRMRSLFRLYSEKKVGIEEVLDTCMELIEFLLQHVYKEDALIFPCCREFSPEKVEEILRCYESVGPNREVDVGEMLKEGGG